MSYYIYILTTKNNKVLYIGYSCDLSRRLKEHRNECIPSFTKRYNVKKLVYYEEFAHSEDALQREKQLKNWKRQWKIELVSKGNPNWTEISLS